MVGALVDCSRVARCNPFEERKSHGRILQKS
jgi:hypothetical protein